jgi:hypothetical protein
MGELIYPREHDWEACCLDHDKLWEVPPWYDELREKVKAPRSGQYAMDLAGLAQGCLELMCARAAFGERLVKKTSVQYEIARCRCDIDQGRLLTHRHEKDAVYFL